MHAKTEKYRLWFEGVVLHQIDGLMGIPPFEIADFVHMSLERQPRFKRSGPWTNL